MKTPLQLARMLNALEWETLDTLKEGARELPWRLYRARAVLVRLALVRGDPPGLTERAWEVLAMKPHIAQPIEPIRVRRKSSR